MPHPDMQWKPPAEPLTELDYDILMSQLSAEETQDARHQRLGRYILEALILAVALGFMFAMGPW